MFHALSASHIAVCAIHSAKSFQQCVLLWMRIRRMHRCGIAASLRSFRSFSVRPCFGLCLNFILAPDTSMSRCCGEWEFYDFTYFDYVHKTLVSYTRRGLHLYVSFGKSEFTSMSFGYSAGILVAHQADIRAQRVTVSVGAHRTHCTWYYNVMQHGHHGHISQLLTKSTSGQNLV